MITSRNYGIDLFRIVSMLMVVTLHVLGQGGILNASIGTPYAYEWAWFLETACFGAVNCFALISGYVGLNSKRRYSNIMMLWLQVLFFSVSLQFAQYCVNPSSFGFGTTLKSFIPLFTKRYWYFSAYTILFFFAPLFNTAILNLDRKTLRTLLLIVTILNCTSSFFPGPEFEDDPFLLKNGYSAMWLMDVYLIGAYIARFNSFHNIKRRYYYITYLICTVLATSSKLVLDHAPEQIKNYIPAGTFIEYTSPFILIASIALLLIFIHLHLPQRLTAIVKSVSPLCFGVYIIHLHPFVWSWLKDRFAFFAAYPLPLFLLAIIATSIGIFVVCLILEKMRFQIFKWLKIKERLSSLEDKILHQ